MRNKLDENDLVLKWTLPIREGIKISSDAVGILEVTIEGETEITSQMLEQMRKDGYMFYKINTYTLSPKPLNDIQNEDDVSSLWLLTNNYQNESIVIKGDSQLVIKQIKRNFKVKAPNIIPLYRDAMSLISKFKHIQFELIPREQNKEADRLSNLAYQEQRLGV